MFLGAYRNLDAKQGVVAAMQEALRQGASANSEFTIILGNEYDMAQKIDQGIKVPLMVRLNDIINIMPPQQFVPFEKLPASEWYLDQLGIRGTGTGLMWGVVTQAITGGKWSELAARGLLLGTFLALVHNWYVRRSELAGPTIIYLFLCLNIYNVYRDTTGAILTVIVWGIIPYSLLCIGVAPGLFGKLKASRTRAAA